MSPRESEIVCSWNRTIQGETEEKNNRVQDSQTHKGKKYCSN